MSGRTNIASASSSSSSRTTTNNNDNNIILYVSTPWGTVSRTPPISRTQNDSVALNRLLEDFVEFETGAPSDTYRLQYGARLLEDCWPDIRSGSVVKLVPRSQWYDLFQAVTGDTQLDAESLLASFETDPVDDSVTDDAIGRHDVKQVPATDDDPRGANGPPRTSDDVIALRQKLVHDHRAFVALCLLCKSGRHDSADVIDRILQEVDARSVLEQHRTPAGRTVLDVALHSGSNAEDGVRFRPSTTSSGSTSRTTSSSSPPVEPTTAAARCLLRHSNSRLDSRDNIAERSQRLAMDDQLTPRGLTKNGGDSIRSRDVRSAPDWSARSRQRDVLSRSFSAVTPWSILRASSNVSNTTNVDNRSPFTCVNINNVCTFGPPGGATGSNDGGLRPSTGAVHERQATLARRRELAREFSAKGLKDAASGSRAQSASYYKTRYHKDMEQSTGDNLPVPRPETAGARYRQWKTWLVEKYEQQLLEKTPEEQEQERIKEMRSHLADEAFQNWLAEKRRCRQLKSFGSHVTGGDSETDSDSDGRRPATTGQLNSVNLWLRRQRNARMTSSASPRQASGASSHMGQRAAGTEHGEENESKEVMERLRVMGENKGIETLRKTRGSPVNSGEGKAGTVQTKADSRSVSEHERKCNSSSSRVGVFQIGCSSEEFNIDSSRSDIGRSNIGAFRMWKNAKLEYERTRCGKVRSTESERQQQLQRWRGLRGEADRLQLEKIRKEMVLEGMTFEEWLGLKETEVMVLHSGGKNRPEKRGTGKIRNSAANGLVVGV